MRPRPRRERGQALVVTVLFMAVLMVAAALTVDYASWLTARRDYQAVVDAAALAGAAQLPPPGVAIATPQQRLNAATDALSYLNEHLGWGETLTSLQADAAEIQDPSTYNVGSDAPLVYTGPAGTYCVWVWTPTPVGAETTGTDSTCQPSSNTLYSPANFPGDGHKVFVRVQSPRPAFFAGIAGIHDEIVPAIAVAGGAHSNYAVIALKPRLSTPDNVSGITITGNSNLTVPNGDVGGNFTLAWGGSKDYITFPTLGLDQRVDLEEPQSIVSPGSGSVVDGSGNVIPGAIEQLADYPIPDPGYMNPLPDWCKAPLSGQTNPWQRCQELHSSLTTSPYTQGNWPWPPSSDLALGTKGVYPACATTADINSHSITCAVGSSIILWPGMYESISLPNSVTTITLSPYCYGTAPAESPYYVAGATPDSDCVNNGRAGVFYFSSQSPNTGLQFNGSNATMSGCGVFLMFDPNESGATGKLQFRVPAGNTVNINSDSYCPGGETMKYSPGSPSGTMPYRWYGYNSPYTNPVSIWVRPNGNGYDMAGSNNGSHVINIMSGATINENGVIYGPQDNTTVSGGPSGSGVGQIVTWTITYTGGSTINETYQGPAILKTRLFQ